MRWHSHNFRAFTLLELVLVLLVMAIIAGMVAPRLMAFAHGRELSNAAQEIVSLTRYARAQAVADSKVYTLNLNGETGVYWVATEEGPEGAKVSTPVPHDVALEHVLPEGVTMTFTPVAAQNGSVQVNKAAQVLHFYPDGRMEAGEIELSQDSVRYVLSCPSATESYRIVQGGT